MSSTYISIVLSSLCCCLVFSRFFPVFVWSWPKPFWYRTEQKGKKTARVDGTACKKRFVWMIRRCADGVSVDDTVSTDGVSVDDTVSRDGVSVDAPIMALRNLRYKVKQLQASP